MPKKRKSKTQRYLADVSAADKERPADVPQAAPVRGRKKQLAEAREYPGRAYPATRLYPDQRAYAGITVNVAERVYAEGRPYPSERLYPMGRLYPEPKTRGVSNRKRPRPAKKRR